MNEYRIIIQQENKDGEFETTTIKTSKDVVGVVFNGDKPDLLITGTDNQIYQASGMLLGYVVGKNEKKVIEMGDKNA